MNAEQARRLVEKRTDEGTSVADVKAELMGRFVRENFEEARLPLPPDHWLRGVYAELDALAEKSWAI